MADNQVQRRLAAIVATDVVGYSRMMGLDEDGALSRLKALSAELLQPKIDEFGGRIVKTTGDGALIEFASAVAAVRHAIDVQNALAARNVDAPEDQRIRLRIGINVGDIIIDDEDIFGDGVNVAARLEGICTPGDICISASVSDQLHGKVAAPLEDMGEVSLKNISRPIRAFSIRLTSGGPAPLAPATPPDRPSIAVLPFDYSPRNEEQENFANGMTEDLTTDLSKIAGLFVVARNSAEAIAAETRDLQQVAARLGVRFLLEGSVRKAGARTRINAQLIDAESGGHLWADRIDGAIDDVFALQDEVGARVVEALSVELSQSEKQRLGTVHTDNLEAYELFVQAKATPYPPIPPRIRAAREMFERVIEMAPDFAGGYAGAAHMIGFSAVWMRQDSAAAGAEAEALARKAISVDQDFGLSYTALGIALVLQGEFAEAVVAGRQAIERQPSDADAHVFLGLIEILSGDPGAGAAHAEDALRLNPRFYAGPYLNVLGQARLLQGDYQAAIVALETNIANKGPVGPPALCSRIAAFIGSGDAASAGIVAAELKRDWPEFTLSTFSFMSLLRDEATRSRFKDMLLTAGVPA